MKNLRNRGGSKRGLKPKCVICDKQKEVSFGGNGIQYPVFSCPEHGTDKNEWEIWWNLYSTRGLEKECWNNKKDRPSCVVSYFCHKYLKFYGFPYVMDYTNPIPYKNKEFTMARRILTMFGENFIQIPNYINWVFHKKVKTIEYPLNSMGFFASSAFVNEYRLARIQKQKVRRSTNIPKDFLEWCREYYPQVIDYHELESYNDLNMLVGIVNTYNNPDEVSVVDEARKRGILPRSGFICLEE